VRTEPILPPARRPEGAGEADLYPSRVGGAAALLPRRDPVVHGAADGGPLDRDQCESFAADGFLVLPGFFAAARVRSLCAELDALLRARCDDRGDEVVREPGGDGIRSLFRIHDTSPVFAALARDARLLAIVEQILGGAVYVHQSRVNLKPGFEGEPFQWHSDFETWHVEDGMPRMRALSCAVNLDRNYEFNGPLMLVPGSHLHFVSCPGHTPEENYRRSLRRQEYGVPDRDILTRLCDRRGIVSATGAPGTVTLFDCNILHASAGNMTPFPRSNVFVVFNSVDNALTEPFSGQRRRPEHIASRSFTALDAREDGG